MDIDALRPPAPTFSRVTNLFQKGEAVEFTDSDGTFFLYVAALNAPEREEAVLDGATAQARATVLNGPGSDTYEALVDNLKVLSHEELVEELLPTKGLDAWNVAQDDVHADPYWRGDRLLLIERGDRAVTAGHQLTEEDNRKLSELNQEYLAAWRTRAVARLEEFRNELNELSDDELIAAYLKAFAQSRTLSAQVDAYRVTMVYYGTRPCQGIKRQDGSIDHAACEGHQRRLFPSREAVANAPTDLLQILVSTAERLDRDGQAALGKS